MNKLTLKHRTTLSCVLLYVFSVLLLSWRLWPVPYAEEAFDNGGALKITLSLECVFTVLYLIMISFKLPLLDRLGAYIKKQRFETPIMTAAVAAVLLLLCAGLQALVDLLPDAWGFGNYSYTALVFLWLIYLLAKGKTLPPDLGRALPYRLAAVPVVILLSRLTMQGFAPAFFLVATTAISDFASVVFSKGQSRRALRAVLCILLPPIICFGLILGAKAILYPEVLDFQIRSMHGAANSYSLGTYIDLLRESGSLGVTYGVCYTALLLIGTACTVWLLHPTTNSYRVAFLGICALFFSLSGFLQALLNAELIRRLMPFQWMVSAGLVCLLANSIVHHQSLIKEE